MPTKERTRFGRNRRRFQPTLHGSLCSGILEPRALTAPIFTRNPNTFNATLLAGSDSQASDQDKNFAFGTGTGFDNLYQTGVSAPTNAAGNWQDPAGNVLYAASESANVTAKVSGPGTGTPDNPVTGQPGDPNPVNSAQIQINVQHTGTDSFTNNTANPFNPQFLLNGAAENSRTTSGNQAGNNLGYVTGATNGNATVTATFQATISGTGANDKFNAGASLTLNSTYLSVTIDAAGLVATDSNGNVVLNDPNFDKSLPFNDARNVTVTVPNVPDNTNLNISYDSSLGSSLGPGPQVLGGPPPAGNGLFPPGVTTDNLSFNWSLTYNIA